MSFTRYLLSSIYGNSAYTNYFYEIPRIVNIKDQNRCQKSIFDL